MRAGIVISAVSHVVLVALALLGTPKLFDNIPVETIEVDLVRPQDAEPPKEPEPKPPEKDKSWNPLPEASAARAPAPAPEPQASSPQPKPQPSTPAPTQQQALGPQVTPSTPPPQPASPWIFDPVNIPKLMDMPNSPPGFDAESTVLANLSNDEKSALKAHLRKCWQLPSGMSDAQSTRVVLRVFLRPNGALASEPMLIEASASRDGPRLMQAAIRTLKECQPFAFLPADKYREWKVLDLSFSPREMAGG